MNTLPSVFVSHGSPMIALEPGAAGAFMQRLGPAIDATFGRPRAIVAISAHTAARAPVLLAASRHQAVYDFGNFDPRLNKLRYDAAGAPELAREVGQRLAGAGIPVHTLDQGGLDHGIWTALRYVYPDADIPVLPLAFVPDQSPAAQFALGAALAPLADAGVLVFGTGSITHNLRRVFAGGLRAKVDQPEIAESAAFRGWMRERSAARDWDALFDYRRQAPHAVDMHPSDEHLLPWYVAAGAGGREVAPQRLHDSVTFGSLAMDAYAFGPHAARLAAQLTASAATSKAAAATLA
ncbi:MAG TPA: class III extradiol ring-cleavage dioxygenase [Burkholderiaceae bacterium]|nr:class III extradiol ring-cleavage dioxygenase [Burkholderiaceae bacterium]